MSALDAAYEALKADGRVLVLWYGGSDQISVSNPHDKTWSMSLWYMRARHRIYAQIIVGHFCKESRLISPPPGSDGRHIAPEAIADIAAAWVLEGRLP